MVTGWVILNEEEIQLVGSYWFAENLITEGMKCHTERRRIQKRRVNEKREMLKGVPIIPITWHNELSKQLWHQLDLQCMDKRYGQCHSKLRCWYGDSWKHQLDSPNWIKKAQESRRIDMSHQQYQMQTMKLDRIHP